MNTQQFPAYTPRNHQWTIEYLDAAYDYRVAIVEGERDTWAREDFQVAHPTASIIKVREATPAELYLNKTVMMMA